jgi:hypothetical protein
MFVLFLKNQKTFKKILSPKTLSGRNFVGYNSKIPSSKNSYIKAYLNTLILFTKLFQYQFVFEKNLYLGKYVL